MSNEWYTPSKYIEAARQVMGSIDLDPASCALANETVQATTYYTKEQDGLSLPWHGNVWLNPPFARKKGGNGSETFIKKLLKEKEAGEVNQAIILLIGLSPYRFWFDPLWEYSTCFRRGSILFTNENGKVNRYGFGSTFVYIGSNEQKFKDVFSQFGHVVMPERVVV